MHYKFSIYVLCPLHASSTPRCDNQKHIQTFLNIPAVERWGGQKSYHLRTNDCRDFGLSQMWWNWGGNEPLKKNSWGTENVFQINYFFWFVWLLHNKKYIIFPPFICRMLSRRLPFLGCLWGELNVILYFQLNFSDKACLVKNKMTVCNVKKKTALGKNVSGFPKS